MGRIYLQVRILSSRKGGQETTTTVYNLNDRDLGKESISLNLEQMELSFTRKESMKTD